MKESPDEHEPAMNARVSLKLEPLEPRVLLSAGFAEQQVITSLVDGAYSVYAADLDGDGDVDVLSASYNDDTVAWYQNLGGGQFGPQRVLTRSADAVTSVCAADLDGDGDVDVLSADAHFAGGTYRGQVLWYENLGGGLFAAGRVVREGNGISLASVCAPDVDGDGDADVLSLVGGRIGWNANLGAGLFGPTQQIAGAADKGMGFYAADLDGNGAVDVVWTALNADGYDFSITLNWAANGGNGSFGPQHSLGGVGSSYGSLYAADLDGDGDVDVLMGSENADRISLYENLGGGSFGPRQVIATDRASALQAADLDGDGDLDLLAALPRDRSVVWYANTGGGSLGPRQVIGQDGAFALYVADIDGDGGPDVVSGAGSQVGWYENLAVTAAAPVDHAPTLTSVSTLTGAVEGDPYTISYATLAAAADEADADGDVVAFRVESVSSGTLTKDGIPVTPGTTAIGPGEALVWTSAPGANGLLPAFTVAAWDGQAPSSGAQVTVHVEPHGYLGAIVGAGGACVSVYDVVGPVDVALANVVVKFGSRGDVQVQLGGDEAMEGLGLVITGAAEVKAVKDGRKGSFGDVAFIAADAPVKAIQVKGGMGGYDLNGLTLGGLTFDADVDGDGDGDTTDHTAIYCSGPIGSIKMDGSVSGDVWIGGADAKGLALKSYSSKSGGYQGDFTAAGDVGKFTLGGDFLGDLNVAGDLGKFDVKAGKAGGGWFRASANVHVAGLLGSVKISFCETDNAGTAFGIRAGAFGKLAIGAWKLDPPALPFQQNDFRVELP
jgi:hypothetical protein